MLSIPHSNTSLNIPKELINEVEIQINKIRVHYLFSETYHINEFIDDCCATFKILDQEKQIIAEAKLNILKQFSVHESSELTAEKQYRNIILVSPRFKEIQLEVN